MSSETKATTDLAEIQQFAEQRDAVPATVRDTMQGDEPGVLTLDFLGHGVGEESLEHIGWDAWYEKFEAAKLALLYQERKADGEPSTFFKLVARDQTDAQDTAGEAPDEQSSSGTAADDAEHRKTGDDLTEDEAAMAMSMDRPAPGETKATTVLEEIQRFAQGCDAVPATVRDTMEGDEPGVLTLDFVGYGAGEESLEHIDWDAWYAKFESSGLALLYQERKADGEPSTFFRLVDRDGLDDADLDTGTGNDTQTDADDAAGDDGGGSAEAAGSGARVRATIAASGSGGRTVRATLTGSPHDTGRADPDDDIDPPEPGDTKLTTDLAEIQRFAQGCDAVPATVRDTMEGDEPGVLTLDFVGYGAGEESLEHIGWDAWYAKFESSGLALLYQERKADGEPSTFFRLVDRERAEG